jgi:hypothetical protein
VNSSGASGDFLKDGPDFGVSIESNNTFEIAGVPPGRYVVGANLMTESVQWSGSTTIDVVNSDLKDVVVAMTPEIHIPGRFVVNGNDTTGKSLEVAAEILLRSDLSNDYFVSGAIDSNSAVSFNNVPVGNYRIETRNLTVRNPATNEIQPAYIDSARAGNQDVLVGGLHVGAVFSDTLNIGLRTDFAHVSGRIVGLSQPLAHRATVAIVPDLRNERSRYRATTADASGQFQLEGIVPGDYKIFAWGDIEDEAWQNLQFLAQNESRGRAVRIVAGDNGAIDITLISGSGKP